MHRFFLPPSHCQGPVLTLAGAEAHHALDVLRVQPGEPIIVLDGAGREFSCTVKNVDRKVVTLTAHKTETSPAPPCSVTLVQAVPKGKLFDIIIQKATELGATRIIPLLSERVATRLDDESAQHKAEKWQQTAIEAIKQCGQRWLPRVEKPITLSELLARAEKFDLSLVGALRAGAQHPREYFGPLQRDAKTRPGSIRIWIGPEGDFTDAELAAIENAGALPIHLGPLVLRSDTAALYALSIVGYELQSWPPG